MAQKLVLVDDLDGGDAEETVSFSLDGVAYEIDLSASNAGRMREALSPYVSSARHPGGASGGGRSGGGRPRRSAASTSGHARRSGSTADIREWARTHGFKVSERGRIPASVLRAYEQDQG